MNAKVVRNVPDEWRDRFGSHPQFVELEKDEGLRRHASPNAVAFTREMFGRWELYPELADLLEQQALKLLEFREKPVPGTSASLGDHVRAMRVGAHWRPETDESGRWDYVFRMNPMANKIDFITREALGYPDVDQVDYELMDLARRQQELAQRIRKRLQERPAWVPSARKRAKDLPFGRACAVVAETIRFYKNDGTTSWPLVVRVLEWYGHDLSHLSGDPMDAIQKAAERYLDHVRVATENQPKG